MKTMVYILAATMVIFSLMFGPGIVLFSALIVAVIGTPLWFLAFAEHKARKFLSKNFK